MTDQHETTSPTVLTFSSEATPTLTHRLFRYPAKFHPPVAAALIEQFSSPGDLILDPFVGSGTTLVEAAVRGRRSIGTDIDPLAVAVSRAKSASLDAADVSRTFKELSEVLRAYERLETTYAAFSLRDISEPRMVDELGDLWVPEVPKLHHWFRRYVVVDLARILATIEEIDCEDATKHFVRVVFASIIRNSSNADPVPVSGLEVTAHMRRLDEAGRVINPFGLLRKAMAKAIAASDSFASAKSRDLPDPLVGTADAATMELDASVDVIITSPPYQNAVDYYRRHQLEMFWLGLTSSHVDRLKLLPLYIGKHRVPASHPMLSQEWTPSPIAESWIQTLDASNPSRSRDFRAYMSAMELVFRRWAEMLRPGGRAVCVVGRSTWNGADIPTERLFVELSASQFDLSDHLTYPVRNRYMSYSRKNGASIDKEHVLVFKRR